MAFSFFDPADEFHQILVKPICCGFLATAVEEGDNLLEVSGDVHANGFITNWNNLDLIAIFQRTKLLQFLYFFEGCGLHLGKPQEKSTPIDIEADRFKDPF